MVNFSDLLGKKKKEEPFKRDIPRRPEETRESRENSPKEEAHEASQQAPPIKEPQASSVQGPEEVMPVREEPQKPEPPETLPPVNETPSIQEAEASPKKEAAPEAPKAAPIPPKNAGPAVAEMSSPPEQTDSAGNAQEVFFGILNFCREIRRKSESGQPLTFWSEGTAFDLLLDAPDLDAEALLEEAYLVSDADYALAHFVIRAILVHYFATALGYSPPTIACLTLAALIAHIGGLNPSQATGEPGKLADYLQDSAELVGAALQSALDLYQQSASRRLSLADDERPLCCKIIAVADVYDQLTHPNSSLRVSNPAVAIRILIEAAEAGEDKQSRRVVKGLIDILSLYPKGSIVRLNTNEVARVDSVHQQAPLRPELSVLLDADQNRLPHPRPVNLLQHPFIYIKDIVEDQG